MREFLGFAFGFPTALFTFSLLVIAGYWLLVLAGGLGVDTLDGEGGDSGGFQGVLAAGGLGGVPVSVVVSLLVAAAWFASLTGSVLIEGAGGVAGAVLGLVVLVAALVAGWSCARVLVLPLRRVFRDGPSPSLLDFVGRDCVIRTGRVGSDFGQAEVTADDGTTALVQVRVPSSDLPVAGDADGTALARGSTALIFDYDPEEGFFWVMPYDAASGPRTG